MLSDATSIVLPCLLFLVACFATWSLISRGWFFKWLRGTIGLFCMSIALLGGLVLADLFGYSPLSNDDPIATVFVEQTGRQHFSLRFETPDGSRNTYDIQGDDWLLDARLIKWSSFLSKLGFNAAFRLDRISGRYRELEDEKIKPRTVYDLNPDKLGVDVWSVAKDHAWIPWVDARYGSSTFLPLSNGAEYLVYVGAEGIYAKPNNKSAEQSITNWQ